MNLGKTQRYTIVGIAVSLAFLAIGPGAQETKSSTIPPSPHTLQNKSEPHKPQSVTTPTTSPTTTSTTVLGGESGGGTSLFSTTRIVAFYGAPGGGRLGILGQYSPGIMWSKLKAQAAQYKQPGIKVLPAYELITYVAQGSAQPDGTYSTRLPNQVIQQYLNTIRKHHGLLILDVQPGRGNFLTDAQTLAPFLNQPDVALALDPEWQASTTTIPGQVIGSTTAAEINQVSNWLENLTQAGHLPTKLLLVHQFTRSMIKNKSDISPRQDVQLVFNMDGFGKWKSKTNSYDMLSKDTTFPLGFKLFYKQDTPMQSPLKVLALKPPPVIIEYE